MIVLDASAAARLLLRLPPADRLAERLFEREESLNAPELFELEVLNVLRRYSVVGGLRDGRALDALAALGDLGVTLYPHPPLRHRVWALRENLTAYDAAYVALAEALGAVLVTVDARLARAPGTLARVELFS